MTWYYCMLLVELEKKNVLFVTDELFKKTTIYLSFNGLI